MTTADDYQPKVIGVNCLPCRFSSPCAFPGFSVMIEVASSSYIDQDKNRKRMNFSHGAIHHEGTGALAAGVARTTAVPFNVGECSLRHKQASLSQGTCCSTTITSSMPT